MRKKVTLLIPVVFNDGTAVPRETLDLIEDQVVAAFKGWTLVGEVAGTYLMQQTGRKQADKLLHVWVVVEEEQIPTLRRMVAEFAAVLKQEVMFFEVSDSVIEFIRPTEENHVDD